MNKDQDYINYISDHYGKVEPLHFGVFISACQALHLEVYEDETTIDPFAEPHERTVMNQYASIDDYIEAQPFYFGHNYDYENDRPAEYMQPEGIRQGVFDMSDGSNSASYTWNFEVRPNGVHVSKVHTITD